MYEWKEQYPTDFGAPGTFGALSALLKQIISNVHLVHYGSELLPFLEELPSLVDKEATWCKKEERTGDESEDENGESEDEVLPALDDDEAAYVGKGKSQDKRAPTQSNPQPPSLPGHGERTHVAKASSSAPNVTTPISPDVPPLPPPPSVGQVPAKINTSGDHLHESVITVSRSESSRPLRVSTKDLQRVAAAIIQSESVHIAQEVTRRMLILFKQVEVLFLLSRFRQNS